jgi:hypothetical protein
MKKLHVKKKLLKSFLPQKKRSIFERLKDGGLAFCFILSITFLCAILLICLKLSTLIQYIREKSWIF